MPDPRAAATSSAKAYAGGSGPIIQLATAARVAVASDAGALVNATSGSSTTIIVNDGVFQVGDVLAITTPTAKIVGFSMGGAERIMPNTGNTFQTTSAGGATAVMRKTTATTWQVMPSIAGTAPVFI